MKTGPGKLLTILLLISGTMLLPGFNNSKSSIPDNNHKTVIIGNQEWMAENLNVSKFRNGDLIPQARMPEEWDEAKWELQPAWCYYNFNPDNGEKYGKLYNWFAVKDSRGLAPEGWHIPSDEEWNLLEKNLGISRAGTKLKSVSGWRENGNGNNAVGFNGLPAGYCDANGEFCMDGTECYWWSSSESETNWGSCRYLDYKDNYLHTHNMAKGAGLSVRCIRDLKAK